TLDKDAAIYQGDILFGIGDDKVQVTGDIFFYHHDSLFNRDRGNSSIPPFLSSNSSPFNLQVSKAVAVAAGGTAITGASPVEFTGPPNGTDGLSPATTYIYAGVRVRGPNPSPLAGFNFNVFSGSYPEQERYGGYVSFNDKVCEDMVQIYGDMYYTKVKTHNELAPGATGSFFTPGQVTVSIPPQMNLAGVAPPNTPRYVGQLGSGPGGALAAGENPTAVEANAFNPFNPFNQIISGGSRARLAEFGNRIFDNTSNAYLATLGIKGDKLLDGNWGYDAGFRYSEIENDSSQTQVSSSRFNRVLNAADPIFDPASDQFIGTTVPYNPFGSFQRPPGGNAATVAFATIHPKDIDISKITELDLNIYTTELFKLPAGGVGLAFGAQFRREGLEQDPDTLEVEGDVLGAGKTAITHAGRKDWAIYGEMRIPLFSPEMNILGLHAVEVTGAFRYEAFRNNDTNVLVPKVGLRWQPFDEQLTIRSTWGEGFREPSLIELYASPTFALTPTNFNGVAEPETATELASNPNLSPEDSRAWTGGFVYTPKWVPWGTLTLSLDLWDIERRGVVTAPLSQEVVNRFQRGVNNGNPNEFLFPGEQVQLDPASGGVNFVSTLFLNAGRQNARGADLGTQYQIQSDFGTFTALSQWSYLDQFVFQPTTFSFGRNIVGQVTNSLNGDGLMRWRGVSRLDWAWHNFDVNATWHYLGGWREIVTRPVGNPMFPNGVHEHWTNPTNFIDGQASYSLIFTPPVEQQPVAGYSKGGKEVVTGKDGKQIESTAAYSMPCWKTILNNSTISVGCNNIFGQDPPKQFGALFLGGNAVGYPGFIYDNIGRFWYVELKKKF
ncbi:MAG TPA: TonB-dependent receptor, partial [Chthoniobacterales bacterium]